MRWIGRIKLRKVAKYGIIITAILAGVFGAFTIYGSQVGNFVVNIEKERNTNLALYDNEELLDPKIQLGYPGLTEQTNATLANIPEDIETGIGEKNDYKNHRYLAFSFMLQNKSEIAVDITMEMLINRATKNVDAAVRVMIIVDGARAIYAKPKDYPETEIGQPEDNPYMTTPFVSPTVVCSTLFKAVASDAVMKVTVVTWLEGYDKQCTDDIKGGSLKMALQFTGR